MFTAKYDINSILFDDTLTCSSYLTTPKLDHLNSNYRKETMLIIMIDSVLCETTVRAVVTQELLTVQQEHTEYVKVNPSINHLHII